MLLGVVAIWVLLRFVILPYEERGLRRAMGEAYEQYARRVPLVRAVFPLMGI